MERRLPRFTMHQLLTVVGQGQCFDPVHCCRAADPSLTLLLLLRAAAATRGMHPP
jgi:hypothetical protein